MINDMETQLISNTILWPAISWRETTGRLRKITVEDPFRARATADCRARQMVAGTAFQLPPWPLARSRGPALFALSCCRPGCAPRAGRQCSPPPIHRRLCRARPPGARVASCLATAVPAGPRAWRPVRALPVGHWPRLGAPSPCWPLPLCERARATGPPLVGARTERQQRRPFWGVVVATRWPRVPAPFGGAHTQRVLKRCRQLLLESPSAGVFGGHRGPPDRVPGWNRWASDGAICPVGTVFIGLHRRKSRDQSD